MPQSYLTPQEVVEFTNEYHIARNTIRSQIIYTIVLLSVIVVIASLPFIYVDVTVQAEGLIRPATEKTIIKPIIQGNVNKIFVSEGQKVNKGDTLLTLHNTNIKSRISFIEFQIKENNVFIHDLKELLSKKEKPVLQTPVYRQTYNNYRQKISEINNRLQKAYKEFNRNKHLYEKEVIAEKEYDDYKYNFRLVEEELSVFHENTVKTYQLELVKKQNVLKQLQSELNQYKQEAINYTIVAPVSGTVIEFAGIYTGSNLNAGQTIATISPENNLIAELYVSPKDIGYLSTQTIARIQVHAFNYNEWGLLQGAVTDISNDFLTFGDKPYFRVRCTLTQLFLQLPNGVRGELKKGMTIRSRFIVTERTLWQLLFNKANDLLNPKMNDL